MMFGEEENLFWFVVFISSFTLTLANEVTPNKVCFAPVVCSESGITKPDFQQVFPPIRCEKGQTECQRVQGAPGYPCACGPQGAKGMKGDSGFDPEALESWKSKQESMIADNAEIINQFEKTLSDQQKIIHFLQTNLSRSGDELNAVKALLSTAESRISTFNEEFDKLEKLKGNLTKAEEEVAELRDDNDRIQIKLSETEGNLTNAEGEVTELRNELNRTKGKVLTLEKELNLTEAKLSEAENTKNCTGFCPVQYDGKCVIAIIHKTWNINNIEAERICSEFDSHPANLYSQSHFIAVRDYIRSFVRSPDIRLWLGMTYNPTIDEKRNYDGTVSTVDLKWRSAPSSSTTSTQLIMYVHRTGDRSGIFNFPPSSSRRAVLCEMN